MSSQESDSVCVCGHERENIFFLVKKRKRKNKIVFLPASLEETVG